jgi:uncharacterized protein (DUF2141 family)
VTCPPLFGKFIVAHSPLTMWNDPSGSGQAGVAPGKYAIAVIQDLNGNKKLDRNIVTKPKEPYGFSGAWKSGAASYEDALIDTEKVGFAVTITLK